MSTIGQLIRKERQAAQMTQEALAAAIGCSKPQLSLMESDRRRVSPDRVRRIEAALGIDDGRLAGALQWDSTPLLVRARVTASEAFAERLRNAAKRGESLDELYRRGELQQLLDQCSPNVEGPLPGARQIPLINRVAAGYPREFTDLDYPVSVADEYVLCPDVTDPDAFAARVVGDSMEPEYAEGEIVIFSPAMDTPPGSDCFVRLLRDNETTFKRIYIENDGRTIRLQPLNSAYPPQYVDREEIGGMYAAAFVMRQVRGGD